MVLGSFKQGVETEEGLACVDTLSAFRTAFNIVVFLPGTLPGDVCHLEFFYLEP